MKGVSAAILLISLVFGMEERVEKDRVEKSLLNSFPFPAGEKKAHHGDHDSTHEGDSSPNLRQLVQLGGQLGGQLGRQYGPADDTPPQKGEKKCVQKVMMQEEIVWDQVINCEHSYDKRCHTTYKTAFSSIQEEECEENFKKICYITYTDKAISVPVQVCKKPLVKDCDIEGEESCKTEYQSECWTKQIPHEVEDDIAECKTVYDRMCVEETEGYTTKEKCEDWPRQECSVTKKKVTKSTPMTGCHKEPIELCAPAGCGFREGAEECHEVVKTHIQETPEEECTLEPVKNCKHITRLVPKLVEVQECADVPKEICTTSRENPRKQKKPIIKNWCYTPSGDDETELQSLDTTVDS